MYAGKSGIISEQGISIQESFKLCSCLLCFALFSQKEAV